MTINIVLFSAKDENKLMIKKILPIMPCRFSLDLFALMKCIGNLTSNKKKSGIKLLMNIDKLMLANIFEIWVQ